MNIIKNLCRNAICIAATTAILINTTALAANEDSFSMPYNFLPGVTSIIKAGASLEGQTFDGSVMHAGDYILPIGGISNYKEYYNGISNMYTWEAYDAGGGQTSYRKVYGGGGTYSGWYGYRAGGECAVSDTSSAIRCGRNGYSNGVTGNGKGGPLLITPANERISYGKYNCDINGYNELTFIFVPHEALPETSVELVQGKAADSDTCTKVVKIIDIDDEGNVKLLGSEQVCATIGTTANLWDSNKYIIMKYILDGRSSQLKHSVKLYKNDTNKTLIASKDMTNITGVNISLSEAVGFRVNVTGTVTNANLSVDQFKLSKVVAPLGIETTQEQMLEAKVPVSGGPVVFDFDKQINPSSVTDTSVTVTDALGNSVSVSASAADDKITVTFPELQENSKYTVNFTNVLPTEGDGYTGSIDVYSTDRVEISSASKSVSGNIASLSINLTKHSNQTEDGVLLVTVKDENSMLMGLYYKAIQLTENPVAPITFTDITLPQDTDYTYSVYLIDSFSTFNLVTDVYQVQS